MAAKPPWDSIREKEIRQVLAELRTLEESGYFDGLPERVAGPGDLRTQGNAQAQLARWAPFAKRISLIKPSDLPIGPALSQFMTQLAVAQRTEPYKSETHRHFQDAVGQVRILFTKILRGEVSSNAIARSIVGSFMDTFMKDRNLLLNLSAIPYSGQDYLYDHSIKLCLLSLSIASAAGYSRAQAMEIAQGALLADVGMMLVPERIRLKRGKLTDGELFEVKKHPIHGIGLLEPIHGLSEAVLLIPYQHHERLHGGGYPDKRSGAMVSRFSRIVGIADVFTALINKRTYREALVPYQAMVAILAMGGQGQLDGDHIKNFLRTISIFPLGSLVRLASGRIGKVVAPNPTEFTKPVITIITAEDGAPIPRDRMQQLDLAQSTDTIVEALAGAAIPHHVMDGF